MYNFNALLSRMKYLPRWGLMRQSLNEDVAQHTSEVMQIAHTLCGIANKIYNKNLNSENIVLTALYHDMSEILTGDMPTPVKYNDQTLSSAYKLIEEKAINNLLATHNKEVGEFIKPYTNSSLLTDYERKILKSADKLSALIKCIEEEKSGNREFLNAYKSIYKNLVEMDLEEVNYFLENMLPAYTLTLDELAKI